MRLYDPQNVEKGKCDKGFFLCVITKIEVFVICHVVLIDAQLDCDIMKHIERSILKENDFAKVEISKKKEVHISFKLLYRL